VITAADPIHTSSPTVLIAGSRAQARFGRWCDRHEPALRVLATAALAWQAAYLAWRIGWGGTGTFLSGLLLSVELYAFVALGALAWFSWRRTPAVRPPVLRHYAVDVHARAGDEPEAVLRATLTGCRRLSYPHTTYLIDTTGRPELARLAVEFDAEYVRGPAETPGELIFLLDGDQVPMPDALHALVGYFADPTVTAVQSPPDYLNHDSAMHYSAELAPGRHAAAVEQHVVAPGAARLGARYGYGSAALVRQAAIPGGRVAFHDEVLVLGVAPATLDAYLATPRRRRGLSLRAPRPRPSQLRPEHAGPPTLASLASHTLRAAPVARLATLAVLVACLWTGAFPIVQQPLALALLWAPALVLHAVATSALSRGYLRLAELSHFELLGIAALAYRAGRRGRHPLVLMYPVTIAGAALAVGLVMHAPTAISVLAAVELYRVARTLYRLSRRQQHRAEYRFAAPFAVRLSTERCSVAGDLQDLNPAGASLVLPRHARVGTEVRLVFAVPDATGTQRRVDLSAEITSAIAVPRGFRLGVRFTAVPSAARQALVEYCYVVSAYQRIRAATPVPGPRPPL
jgi:hypothetical protein